MSKTSKTNSTQTSNGTTNLVQTPTNPQFVTNDISNLAGQISGLSSVDPTSFVAGPDPLQTQAGTAAAGLTSSPDFGTASNTLSGLSGSSVIDGLQNYMNPYTKDVTDAALKDYDFGSGQTQAQNQLALANDSTFGGSGGAIQTSMSNDAINRGRGNLSATLNDQAFNTASQLALADRNQQIAAAQGLTSNGTASGADTRANVGTQADIGSILQQLAQTKAVAPLSLLGAQTSLLSGLPLSLLHGTNQDGTTNSTSTGNSTTTTSDPFGALGGLLGTAGSLGTGLGALGISFGKAA